MSAVSVKSLVVEYGDKRVVHSLDLEVEEGSFVTLLGPSGCGKTTTLRCIAGLERPASGSISYGERVVYDSGSKVFVPPEKRRPGLVFQSYGLWPHLTVSGNVDFPMKMQKVKKSTRRAKVAELLELVGLAQRAGDMAGNLSGGQQQRVALARALANGSSLILYDEPLSNLDAQLRLSTRKQIKSLHETLGTTSILVTHDQDEAMSLSDVVVVMDEGRIAQTGTPQEVYESPATAYVARFVGFENLLDAEVVHVGDGSVTVRVDAGGMILASARLSPGLPADLKAGDHVTLACRALNVQVGSAAGNGTTENQVTGLVSSVEFAGDRTHYVVQVDGVELRASILNSVSRADWRVGDEMSITIPPDELVCLPFDGHAPTKEAM